MIDHKLHLALGSLILPLLIFDVLVTKAGNLAAHFITGAFETTIFLVLARYCNLQGKKAMAIFLWVVSASGAFTALFAAFKLFVM